MKNTLLILALLAVDGRAWHTGKPPVLGGGPTNTKVPDISFKEVEEITQAAKFAYGNQAADDFLDTAMEEAKKS